MTPVQYCHIFLILVLVGKIEVNGSRIVGGVEVEPYSIEYQASLQYNKYHFCGGVLISDQWVVSAAHCWRPRQLIKVVLNEHRLGKTDGFEQTFDVSKVIVHHMYKYRTFDNDIMLIKLDRPVDRNSTVQPAVLPDASTPTVTRHSRCRVSGWGVTQVYSYYLSPALRAVDVDVIPRCKYYYYFRITQNMLCAGSVYGGKDSCQGDSGGPLICDDKLEGIVSWGISCANPYFPGVYTKVRKFLRWINWVIQRNS